MFTGDEEPTQSDEKTDASAHAERACGTDLIDECAADEASDKDAKGSNDPDVARLDPSSTEQHRIGHEFAPDGGQNDCQKKGGGRIESVSGSRWGEKACTHLWFQRGC